MKFDVNDLKRGIQLVLPLLKLIAARTATKYDDQLIAFLEAMLSADSAKVTAFVADV